MDCNAQAAKNLGKNSLKQPVNIVNINSFAPYALRWYFCTTFYTMKVTDYIAEADGKSLVSFEILPPLKGKGIGALWNHLDPLMEFKPAFINVTYHRSESMFK